MPLPLHINRDPGDGTTMNFWDFLPMDAAKISDRSTIPAGVASVFGTIGWAASSDILWLIPICAGAVGAIVNALLEFRRRSRLNDIDAEIHRKQRQLDYLAYKKKLEHDTGFDLKTTPEPD